MEERILLCKCALTSKPIVINITITAADEAVYAKSVYRLYVYT